MEQSNHLNYLDKEKQFYSNIEEYFLKSSGTYSEKMHAFSRFVQRQSISYFLARTEIYKEIINLHGSVFDFGIHKGSSFFTWIQLSSIFEPYNHVRKFIGFDSFEGFSEIMPEDINQAKKSCLLPLKQTGAMKFENGHKEMEKAIELMDLNRPLGHINNAFIQNGVLPDSLEDYLHEHEETIIALANFGLGLYAPTVKALSLIKPKLQKGSILVFEEANQANWPGETKALYEVFDKKEITLKRFPFALHISYMIYQ